MQIPGGIIEESCVLRGVMINKDVTHPRMRRHIKNPRIVLLDTSLEYKKGESQVRFLAPHLKVGVGVWLPMRPRGVRRCVYHTPAPYQPLTCTCNLILTTAL